MNRNSKRRMTQKYPKLKEKILTISKETKKRMRI